MTPVDPSENDNLEEPLGLYSEHLGQSIRLQIVYTPV